MNLVELAQRIQNHRLAKRMTLEDVAGQAGLSTSWLSKVENFRITPSLPALGRISAALGVPLSDLVKGLDEKPELTIVRAGKRKVVERSRAATETTVYESLAHDHPNRAMDPYLVTIPGGSSREVSLSHEGEEFITILDGRIRFEYDGTHHEIKEGDSLYFDANVEHRLTNPADHDAKILCVFCTASGGSADG